MIRLILYELKDITKKYGNRIILNKINMKINKGEFISITGLSGSGKSTLLYILGFLDSTSSGECYFENTKIDTHVKREKIRNNRIGFVFQSYNLIPDMTVYENILLPCFYASKINIKYVKHVKHLTHELIAKYNLSSICNCKTQFLSGGEKQRVCLARAVISDHDVICLDEPTGNLDVENASIVMDELKKLNKTGKTIIVVTHDTKIASLSKQNYILSEGKLI